MTLAALLCRERLLPYTSDDTTQPIYCCYLADFDVLLSGESLSNRRTVFERIGYSFLRVLATLGDKYEDMIQLLAVALDKDAPSLESFDGLTDQYGAPRIKNRDSHLRAYNEVMNLRLMKKMLELGMDDGSPPRSTDNISEDYWMVELGTDDGSPSRKQFGRLLRRPLLSA